MDERFNRTLQAESACRPRVLAAAVGDVAELFDVEVDQLAGCVRSGV
jgi:hypothetical protein